MRQDSHSPPLPIEMLSPEPALVDRPQMYVIALEKGNHDNHSTTILSVTDDLAGGQAWVDKMNGIYRTLQQKRQLLTVACLTWRQTHPMPLATPPVMLEVPKPATDRPPTIEEREEKHRINNENLLRSLASRDPQRQWARQESAFCQAWLAENLTPEEAEMDTTANENSWSIQPVPWHSK